MIRIETILFATDFSESSESAAGYAMALAKLTGAQLHVLHVINELDDPQRVMIPNEAFRILEKELESQAVAALEAFRRDKAADLQTTTHVVIGTPFQKIVEMSEQLDANIIVMGTHGRTGVEHVIVGSTAERVVRHSAIPVLTVRGKS